MSKEILKEHYERKYDQESSASSIELIGAVQIPTSRFEAAVKFIPRHLKGGKILEIGAGNGNVAKTLLSSNTNIVSYTLSDLSQSRVEGIRRNLSDSRVSILEMDAEDIPSSEYCKFDAVIMIALIEHLIDPLRAMRQVRQLLRPDGFVYIDTPNIAKYTRRVNLLLGRFPSTASMNEGLTTYSGEPADLYDEGHLHYFTYRSLSLMLTERCGFSTVIKHAYPAGSMPLGNKTHNLLANMWPELFSELAIIACA